MDGDECNQAETKENVICKGSPSHPPSEELALAEQVKSRGMEFLVLFLL